TLAADAAPLSPRSALADQATRSAETSRARSQRPRARLGFAPAPLGRRNAPDDSPARSNSTAENRRRPPRRGPPHEASQRLAGTAGVSRLMLQTTSAQA